MATKAELLVEAEKLSIENAESLSYNDLKKAVSKAKKALDTANTQDNTGDNPDANQGEENTQDNTGDASGDTKGDETPLFFEDENGNKFGFTKRTPEKFRFNGVIKTQAEWLQDEDAMEMLIYGNSMYINQLKN